MSFQDDLIAKYADKVTPEHRMAMEAVGFTRQVLSSQREYFQELVDAEHRIHSVGIVVDPTLYRDALYSDGLKQQIRMCKAALAFLNEIDAIAAEIQAKGDQS